MATIVKTASGNWKAIIRQTGWPTTCKTFRLKRDARDWARHTEDGIRRGIHIRIVSPARMLFADAIDRYLEEVTPRKRPRTQGSERQRAALLKAFFGRYALAAITPELIARYRDVRLASHVRSPNWSKAHSSRRLAPATVRLELALLSHLFTVAIRQWQAGLLHNPVSSIQRPAPSVCRQRRLEAGDEGRLMAAIAGYPNPMLGWIVRIAIETGMRAGEIGGLCLDQVDLRRRVVTLEATKNGRSRDVPLTQVATRVLTEAIAHPGRPQGCDLVFPGKPARDGSIRPYRFSLPWWKLKNRLGLTDLRFHDLRHEAISRLVEAGLSDQQVASISGHQSMQMLKRYTHLRAEDLVRLLDRPQRTRARTGRRRSLSPEMHLQQPN